MEKLDAQQAARLASLSVKRQISANDLQRITVELQLRQWCIEEANKVVSSSEHSLLTGEDRNGKVEIRFATVDLANQILNFVTVPLREQQ